MPRYAMLLQVRSEWARLCDVRSGYVKL